jgi:hypothetical protein
MPIIIRAGRRQEVRRQLLRLDQNFLQHVFRYRPRKCRIWQGWHFKKFVRIDRQSKEMS